MSQPYKGPISLDCIKHRHSICDVTHRFLKSRCKVWWSVVDQRHVGSPTSAGSQLIQKLEKMWSLGGVEVGSMKPCCSNKPPVMTPNCQSMYLM